MPHSLAHDVTDESKKRSSDVMPSDMASPSFGSYQLPQHLLKGLTRSGFSVPSPIQQKAIPIGRCGLDMVVQAKSGTGKTCVFVTCVLDMLLWNTKATQALIMAPTREIAFQIAEAFKLIGRFIPSLTVKCFIGGQNLETDKKDCKNCQIAIGTPGRLTQLIREDALTMDRVRIFVLDEADMLLEESFQSNINWIFSKLPKNKQVMVLSATYPQELADVLTKYMRTPAMVRLDQEDVQLLGIKQYGIRCDPLDGGFFESKLSALHKLFSRIEFAQCIVFTQHQQRAESICKRLQKLNYAAMYISGQLSQKDRNAVMRKLKSFTTRIMVSTDLTSRGIDAENVNLVVNFDIPNDSDIYLHRIGRAGRYGSFGLSVSLFLTGDEEYRFAALIHQASLRIKCLPGEYPSDLVDDTEFWQKCQKLELKPSKRQHIRNGSSCYMHERDGDKVYSRAKMVSLLRKGLADRSLTFDRKQNGEDPDSDLDILFLSDDSMGCRLLVDEIDKAAEKTANGHSEENDQQGQSEDQLISFENGLSPIRTPAVSEKEDQNEDIVQLDVDSEDELKIIGESTKLPETVTNGSSSLPQVEHDVSSSSRSGAIVDHALVEVENKLGDYSKQLAEGFASDVESLATAQETFHDGQSSMGLPETDYLSCTDESITVDCGGAIRYSKDFMEALRHNAGHSASICLNRLQRRLARRDIDELVPIENAWLLPPESEVSGSETDPDESISSVGVTKVTHRYSDAELLDLNRPDLSPPKNLIMKSMKRLRLLRPGLASTAKRSSLTNAPKPSQLSLEAEGGRRHSLATAVVRVKVGDTEDDSHQTAIEATPNSLPRGQQQSILESKGNVDSTKVSVCRYNAAELRKIRASSKAEIPDSVRETCPDILNHLPEPVEGEEVAYYAGFRNGNLAQDNFDPGAYGEAEKINFTYDPSINSFPQRRTGAGVSAPRFSSQEHFQKGGFAPSAPLNADPPVTSRRFDSLKPSTSPEPLFKSSSKSQGSDQSNTTATQRFARTPPPGFEESKVTATKKKPLSYFTLPGNSSDEETSDKPAASITAPPATALAPKKGLRMNLPRNLDSRATLPSSGAFTFRATAPGAVLGTRAPAPASSTAFAYRSQLPIFVGSGCDKTKNPEHKAPPGFEQDERPDVVSTAVLGHNKNIASLDASEHSKTAEDPPRDVDRSKEAFDFANFAAKVQNANGDQKTQESHAKHESKASRSFWYSDGNAYNAIMGALGLGGKADKTKGKPQSVESSDASPEDTPTKKRTKDTEAKLTGSVPTVKTVLSDASTGDKNKTADVGKTTWATWATGSNDNNDAFSRAAADFQAKVKPLDAVHKLLNGNMSAKDASVATKNDQGVKPKEKGCPDVKKELTDKVGKKSKEPRRPKEAEASSGRQLVSYADDLFSVSQPDPIAQCTQLSTQHAKPDNPVGGSIRILKRPEGGAEKTTDVGNTDVSKPANETTADLLHARGSNKLSKDQQAAPKVALSESKRGKKKNAKSGGKSTFWDVAYVGRKKTYTPEELRDIHLQTNGIRSYVVRRIPPELFCAHDAIVSGSDPKHGKKDGAAKAPETPAEVRQLENLPTPIQGAFKASMPQDVSAYFSQLSLKENVGKPINATKNFTDLAVKLGKFTDQVKADYEYRLQEANYRWKLEISDAQNPIHVIDEENAERVSSHHSASIPDSGSNSSVTDVGTTCDLELSPVQKSPTSSVGCQARVSFAQNGVQCSIIDPAYVDKSSSHAALSDLSARKSPSGTIEPENSPVPYSSSFDIPPIDDKASKTRVDGRANDIPRADGHVISGANENVHRDDDAGQSGHVMAEAYVRAVRSWEQMCRQQTGNRLDAGSFERYQQEFANYMAYMLHKKH